MLQIQGFTLTVGQAYASSQRFAGFLHQLGVQPEERVGVFMTNSCATATTVFGIGLLRGMAVMLNTELRSSFLRHQFNDCQLARRALRAHPKVLLGFDPHAWKSEFFAEEV